MKEVRADLHAHLGTKKRTIEQGFDRIVDIVESNIGQGGIIGLANFEHSAYFHTDEYRYFDCFYNLKSTYERNDLDIAIHIPEKGLTFIRSEEVATEEDGREIHLVVVGTKKGTRMTPHRSLVDTIEEARDKNAIVIAPHISHNYGVLRELKNNLTQAEEILYSLDAVELHNGICIRTNKKTQDWYYESRGLFPQLGAVYVSDGKSPRDVGTSYVNLNAPDNYLEMSSEELNKHLRKIVRANRDPTGERKDLIGTMVKHSGRVLWHIVSGKRKK